MELKDLIITPVYLILIYVLLLLFKNKFTNNTSDKYFIPAVTARIVSSILLGIIYKFYYRWGDTYNYFYTGKKIYLTFFESPMIWLKILFSSGIDNNSEVLNYTIYLWNFHVPSSAIVIKSVAFLSVFCGGTYSVVAVFFALISFSGSWCLYITLSKIYPTINKKIAYSTLFIPSFVFWGSGILKEAFVVAGLGWSFYSLYNLIILRKKVLYHSVLLLASFYVIYIIKSYILICFLPTSLIWLVLEFQNKMPSKIRFLVRPIFFFVAIGFSILAGQRLMEEEKKYSIENIGERTKITANYIYKRGTEAEGSTYKLGELDGSIQSMIRLAPQAIFVTLYRPFLWEVKNPLMFLSAIESSFLLILTISTFIRVGVFRAWKIIWSEPLLLFFLLFSLIFAFGVGISSFNFGTLVRYKIPLLPFYTATIFILGRKLTRVNSVKNLSDNRRMAA